MSHDTSQADSPPTSSAAPDVAPDAKKKAGEQPSPAASTEAGVAPEAAPEAPERGAHAPDAAPAAAGATGGKGIGFLGRRGTAPIPTSAAGDAAGDPAAENGGEGIPPAAPARPAAPPPKAGMSENAFRLMSLLAPLFLLVLLLMQTAAGIYFPSLYLPAEVAAQDAYAAMAAAGQWLATPAGLPGFYWFMRMLDAVPGLPPAFFLPVVACACAVAALWGTYALGLCAGLGNRTAFAAGLILLSCLGFVPLTHWVGPELLLAGLVAFALACLCKGWLSEGAILWLGLGGLFSGVAFLVGGVPAIWIPLISSIALLLWRGTLRRGHRMDAVAGFLLLLLCVVGWLGSVILFAGEKAQALAPLTAQLFAPFLPPLWPPRDIWWQALAALPLALLPWTLIPLFVSWGAVLGNAWKSLKASRKENAGTTWLWFALATGLLLLTIASHKPVLAVVILLPPGALLLAKALMNLSYGRSRALYLLLAVLWVVAGAGLALAGIPAVAKTLHGALADPLPQIVAAMGKGLPVVGAVCLLCGLCLLKLTNRSYPGGALTVVVLFITILAQPASLMISPALVDVVGVQHACGMGVGTVPGAVAPARKAAPAEQPAAPAVPSATDAKPAPATDAAQDAPAQPEAAPAPAVPATDAKPAPAEGQAPATDTKSVPAEGQTPAAAPAAPATAPVPAPAEDPAAPALETSAATEAPAPLKDAPAAPKTTPEEGAAAPTPAPAP